MSYYDQATGINSDLKQLFSSVPINEFNLEQRERILNIMIRLGQVAKFRCRSNAAYDNFIASCLRDIADTARIPIREGEDFEVLTARIKQVVVAT